MSRPKKIITRDKGLRIRLTQEEYEMIKYYAEQNNMSMSEGIRQSVLRLGDENEKIPLYFSNGEKLDD